MRPLPLTPRGRRALAERLARRAERLSERQRRLLKALGDDAVAALLLGIQDEANRVTTRSNEAPQDRVLSMGSLLQDAMRPEHTKAVLDLFERLPPGDQVGARAWLARAIRWKGDRAVPVHPLMDVVRLGPGPENPDCALYEVALEAVARSDDPAANRFLLGVLLDPQAEPSARYRAFANVARSGAPDAVAAVLGFRSTRRTIPSLAEFIGLDELGPEPSGGQPRRARPLLLDTAVAADGARWALLTCWALGAEDDLWVARHDGCRWVDLLFTGVTRTQLGDQDWVSRFVGNPDLSRDSDRDGWTDVMELRLGTDPRNPDTDGDGIPDGVDMNPLAAPRPLGDTERILAAALDALFFGRAPSAPCLVHLPPCVEPFELHGWGWITITLRAGEISPMLGLGTRWEVYGAAEVRFGAPRYDFAGRELSRRGGCESFLWSNDRSEVRLGVGFGYGHGGSGFDVHLRRFGGEWLVVDLEMTCFQ